MPFASVFPLVTARAVARPFTYEVEEGVGPGAIVTMPFGRRRARGVVVALEDSSPEGVVPVPIDRVVGQVPPALVDLALWIAAYYGSTPARALALVAPELPKRRKEQAPPAERQSFGGEAEPDELLPEQRVATDRIVSAIDAGSGGAFLLYGPTGSGKTEVYLQACAAVLERGLGAILLVPEISLAPQTVGRVHARFGDRVAILHSGLTDAERRDERVRIASGEARIVVGARSAIFAPVHGLGLIVVDEEHEASYKQDSDPRYDARTVAVKRAALEGAVAVFGSATPRPESWAALERLELGGRVGADLPPVKVVDMRREAGYPLSAPLLGELRRVLESNGKAMLLLNRRGIAPALHCRACGGTIRCPNCDVALVLHRDAGSDVSPLRPSRAGSGDLPHVRLVRARAARRGNAVARARAHARVPRSRPDPARCRHRDQPGADVGDAAALLRGGPCGAARNPDDRQGPSLPRRRARGGRRRRRLARLPGFPGRGAHLPAAHPARRPQRP